MWECEWRRLHKTGTRVKEPRREMFPYRRSLREYQLLEEIMSGKVFGFVQCDMKVPFKLKPHFPNFPLFFKGTLVDRKDIGKTMKQCAQEQGLMCQHQKILASSFKLQTGTVITPLLLLYFELGLVSTKLYRFVEYNPKLCFNRFVQSPVNERRQGNENPNSNKVAGTRKLLANSSSFYQKWIVVDTQFWITSTIVSRSDVGWKTHVY